MAYRGSLKGEMINIAKEDELEKVRRRKPKFMRDFDAKMQANMLLIPMMTGGTAVLSERSYYIKLTEILKEKGLYGD